MVGDDEFLIERCALIADDAIAEISSILNSKDARQSRYDRQTKIQLRTSMRWCKRIASGIRGLPAAATGTAAARNDNARLDLALNALREMKPVLEAARSSHWKQLMLQRIDNLLGEDKAD